MTRRVAFINEKGGTGKTTLAVNLAAYWSLKKQKKVLLIDLDTQGHAGKCLGMDVRTLHPTIFDWLCTPEMPLQSVVQSTSIDGLSVVPAYKQMAGFPAHASQFQKPEFLLADKLGQSDVASSNFDYIVFDSPPSLGLTTLNILTAATEVIIPVSLSYLSLDGCAEMVRTLADVNARLNPQVRISHVVPTMYRKTGLADEILEKLKEYFPSQCHDPLPLNVKIDEAQSHAKTIWEYAPWSKGATTLQSLADSIESSNETHSSSQSENTQLLTG